MRFDGELFFPMDVERYVRACSLWLYHPDEHDEQVVPEGELTIEKLVEPRTAEFGSVFYIRLVHPLSLDEGARALRSLQHLRDGHKYTFRTGLGSACARGSSRGCSTRSSPPRCCARRVPKATAAAAALEHRRNAGARGEVRHHGRVAREGG